MDYKAVVEVLDGKLEASQKELKASHRKRRKKLKGILKHPRRN